jgi:hypothetical protein
LVVHWIAVPTVRQIQRFFSCSSTCFFPWQQHCYFEPLQVFFGTGGISPDQSGFASSFSLQNEKGMIRGFLLDYFSEHETLEKARGLAQWR